jgi:AraC family transcriptional activator of pobA
MKKETKQPTVFNSVSELNAALGLPKPLHPLISLNYYKDMNLDWSKIEGPMAMNLYKISYKTGFTGRFRYGQHYYDFDGGGMCLPRPTRL